MKRIYFYIIFFALFYCQSKKSGFLFRTDTGEIGAPEITFYYGKLGDLNNQSDTYFETVGDQFCLLFTTKTFIRSGRKDLN